MELKLNPEDIEHFVKESLIKSGIGKSVQDAIQSVLSPNNYNNPIKTALEGYIKTVISEMLREKFSTQIKEAINAYLEQQLTQDLVNKMTNAAVEKMISAARDY